MSNEASPVTGIVPPIDAGDRATPPIVSRGATRRA